MDFLMHGLIGFFLGGLFGDTIPHAQLILVIASMIPDIDLIYISLGKLSYFKHHRKLTHSPFGVLGLSLIIASFFDNFLQAFILSVMGILVHIFFDLTNHFGTSVFYPFSNKRYAWEFTNVVEMPLYTIYAIMLALLFYFNMKSVSELAIIFSVIYLGFKMTLHRVALNYAKMRYGKSRVIPHFWNIFSWHIIHEEKNSYVLSDLNLIKGEIKRAKSYKKAPEFLKTFDKKLNEFFDFAKYPVIENKDNKVEIKDLRFFASEHFMIVLERGKDNEILEKFKT